MNQSAYYGHESQLFGVEEVRLQGGKGDGMRLLQVRNGKGLEFTVSADRCADISRLHFRGENCGFFSANGYVAPAYYARSFIWVLLSVQRCVHAKRPVRCSFSTRITEKTYRQ